LAPGEERGIRFTRQEYGKRNRLRIGGGRRERSAGNYDDGDECDAVYGDGIGDGALGTAYGGNSVHLRPTEFYDCGGLDGVRGGRQDYGDDDAAHAGQRHAIPITGFADGATNQTFNWNVLSGTNPLIAQVAAPSSASAIDQDGSSSGSLVNFTIGGDGTITGSFSNGKTQALGQIALANFANVNGLQLDAQPITLRRWLRVQR